MWERLPSKKLLLPVITLIPGLLVLLFRPLGLDPRQGVFAATLITGILWWVTDCLPKWLSSSVVLLVFCLFRGAPLVRIFSFPLSSNFPMVLFSYLFSAGIKKSGLVRKYMGPLLGRFIGCWLSCLLMICVLSLASIFIIPEPFARVILLALVFGDYLDSQETAPHTREVLLFAVYAFSLAINMMFLRGDIVVNNAVTAFAEQSLGEWSWTRAMGLPVLGLVLLETLTLRLVFPKALKGFSPVKSPLVFQRPTPGELRCLWVVAATVLFMATEPLHGLPPWMGVAGGSLAMFLLRLLEKGDLRVINGSMLLFLTAAFSIGAVMTASGVAELIFSRLTPLFPAGFGAGYLLVIAAITVVLHMCLGSVVTSTAVLIPGILTVSAGVAEPLPVMFFIYLLTYGHYIIPLHNVMLVFGQGEHYSTPIIVRFGLALTPVVLLAAFLLFVPWWRFLGMF